MSIERFKTIAELEKNEILKRPVFLTKIEEKTSSKNGKVYVTLTCSDGKNIFNANMFDVQSTMLINRGIKENSIVTISVTKNINGYINVNSIDPNEYDDVTLKDFALKIDEDVNELFDELINILKVNENKELNNGKDSLSSLAIKILKENEDNFKFSSAAILMHHEKSGGLLLHSLNVTKGCLKLLDIYKDADRELTLCGAALHDVGKMIEYTTNDMGMASLTPMMQGLGHAILGIEFVDREMQKGNYNEERVNLLKTIIASHHGSPDKGACCFPIIKEAVLVHMCDELDATYDEFKKGLALIMPGENSEKKPGGLDSKIYKPTYEE